jgi:ADP-ribose pyrophosphatase YjhB (NUDIX family)
MKDPDAAAREAREEAGVSGKIGRKSIGFYRYFKREGETAALVEVSVFMLKVRKERKTWDEQKERQRAWFEIDVAARRVREPRLKALILSLKMPRPDTAAKV